MFLKVKGVDGESKDSKHKKEIDVLAWSWGLSNSGSAHVGGGAGAGKVTFNPFQVTRKTDRASPVLFSMCCAGQHFKMVSLYLRRAGGGAGGVSSAQSQTMTSGTTFLRFDFALVAVKTISWSGSDGDEACKEEVTFEYGALQIRYVQQKEDGTPMTSSDGLPQSSWNRVYNNSSFDLAQGIKAS